MSEIDKASLYGNFQRQADKRSKLGMKAAHKALDIADDDMTINSSKTGIGPLGAIGIALAAGLPAVLLGGSMILPGLVGSKPGAAPVSPAPVVAQPPVPPGLNPWDEIQEVQQPDGTFVEKPGSRQPFGKFPKEWLPPNGGIVP